jgi:peptidoglycan/LPS O-acetylase OafA/YrhL
MALAAALCVAATTGIVAILSGSFDRTEGRVVVTSLGFAVFSAAMAPGASLRLRQSGGLRALGAATIGFSVASFVLLVVALWNEGDETLWRTFGCAGFAALACSHASLVTAARRRDDGPTVVLLCASSVVLGVVDAAIGVAAVSGAVEEVDPGFVELTAVLVILLVLTTALQPIARRIASPRPQRGALSFADEVLAAADRIDELNGDPGNRAPEIRREVERLRGLARAQSS